MGLVYLLAIEPHHQERVVNLLPGADFAAVAPDELQDLPLGVAEAVVIGPDAENLIALVQHLYKKDPLVSLIVLVKPEVFPAVRQAIQFAPFIGKYTYCYSFDSIPVVELQKALEQAGQRKRFHKLRDTLHVEVRPKLPVLHIGQLGSFLEQAPIGAVLLDDNLQIIAINAIGKELLCAGTIDVQPEPLEILVGQAVATRIVAMRSLTAQDQRTAEFHIGRRYLDITVAEVIDEQGLKFTILLINDVTLKRQEEQRLRTILDALPQMGWLSDTAGKVNYLTQGWYHYTGQLKSDSASKWPYYLHKEDIERTAMAWEESLVNGTMFEQEIRYKRYSGEYLWHLVRAVPILNSDNKIDYWLGTATNIDQQKQIEKDLEEQVARRTAELSESNQQLLVSNKDLKEFAHVASHDLQEPLRKVMVFTSLIKEDITNTERNLNYLNKINRAAARMTDLIHGVLEHSNLANGKEEATPVDLNKIIDGAKEEYELAIAEKGAVIKGEDLPVVKGDRLQMQQLFNNLISNALKYNNNTPEITISYHVADVSIAPVLLPKEHKYYEIKVKDNGIGFDQMYAEKIFRIFGRLHSKEEYSGTGIGLALCKKIVENHRGYITAVSKTGGGSTFYIYLPVQ